MATRQRTHIERETKFDVDGSFRLPDLDRATGRKSGTEQAHLHLESTYYDTADLALIEQRITLRRRTGDGDTGWQLKVPHGVARLEIGLPLAAGDGVPQQLSDIVAGVAHGAPLEPVAVLRTDRRAVRLTRGDEVLAEVADDTVHAAAAGDAATVSQWREVEVELVDGDEALLATLGQVLTEAGARPAASPSKLARALDRPEATGRKKKAGRPDATAVLRDYLTDQYAAMIAGDVALRRGRDDAVHKTRVAVRRLRSALRVFAPVLDPEPAHRLEADLSWYQNLLGAVRDAQVQRARIAGSVAALPVELVLGPVAADLDQALLADQARELADLLAALTGDRYRDLLTGVRAFVADPPVRAGVSATALPARAAAARRTARKRLARARRSDDPMLTHRARKAVKRARYASEAVRPLTGAKATKKDVRRMKRLQQVLGDYQDSVVGAALLRRIGAGSGAQSGHNGFTYGLLYADERRRQQQLRKRVAALR